MKQIYEDYITKMEELRAQRAAVVDDMFKQYDEMEEKYKQLECDETLKSAIIKHLKKMWDCVLYARSHESATLDSAQYARNNFREFEEVKNVLNKLMS